MKEISESLYKPGDFRKAIENTHNYGHLKREEIEIPVDDLLACKSPEEKWELLEKTVKSNFPL